jgi:hypothetical protein
VGLAVWRRPARHLGRSMPVEFPRWMVVSQQAAAADGRRVGRALPIENGYALP